MVGDHEVAVGRAHRGGVGAQVGAQARARRPSSRARARRSRRPRAPGRSPPSPSRRRRSGRTRRPRARRPSPRAPSGHSRSRSPRSRAPARGSSVWPESPPRRTSSSPAAGAGALDQREPVGDRVVATAAARGGRHRAAGPAAPLCSMSIGWRRRTIVGATASARSRRATRSLSATAAATWPLELRRQLQVERLAVGDEELRQLGQPRGELVRGAGVLHDRGVRVLRVAEVVDDLDPALRAPPPPPRPARGCRSRPSGRAGRAPRRP